MTYWKPAQILPVLRTAGFGTKHTVPGEPHGLTHLEMALCVVLAESGGNPQNVAVGDQHGCDSVGWFQLNGCNYPYQKLLTPLYNAQQAFSESSEGTVWTPWCTVYGAPCGQCGHRSSGDSYLRQVAPDHSCPSNSTGVPRYFAHVSTAQNAVQGVPGPRGGGVGPPTSIYIPPPQPVPAPSKAVAGESAQGLIGAAAQYARLAAVPVIGSAKRIRTTITNWR